MLTCREASHLMSQAYDRKLGLLERLGLKAHLLICDACRKVKHQLDLLHRFSRKVAAEPEALLDLQPGLSAEAQARILKELHRVRDG